MKKFICLALALTMVVSTFAGGNKEKENSGEKVVSMLYKDNAAYPFKEDWATLQWIKEETGVTLDAQLVPESDWEVKKGIVLNSGEIPDIIASTFVTSSDVVSGLILPVSQYEDRMPNFQAYIEKYNLREELDATRFADGNYYNLPAKARNGKIQDQQWIIRTDIFEKHGIKIPTTMDEMYEAGVQLKKLYPDSTPITNRFGSANILTGFASAYGVIAGWTYGNGMTYDFDTKEWFYVATSDGYKEMLTMMNKMLKAGVLDMEFSTLDSTVYEQRIVQGDTFMMYDWSGNMVRYNSQGKDVDPNYQVKVIYPPEGSDGNYALSWKATWDQGMMLPASLADDEEQLQVVLDYIDWSYSDEASVLLTFGKEGETWKYNDAGYKVYMEAGVVDYSAKYGLDNNNYCIREDNDFLYGTLSADQAALFEKIALDGVVPLVNPQSPLTPDELEETNVLMGTCNDYVTQMTEKFIFGTEKLANWNDFVATLKAKGYEKIVKLYND